MGVDPAVYLEEVQPDSPHEHTDAPGVPLHFPEHEAIEVFGNQEEYDAALRGDPVPAFRGKLIQDGVLSAEEADQIVEDAKQEMQQAVDFGIESPLPEPEDALKYVYA